MASKKRAAADQTPAAHEPQLIVVDAIQPLILTIRGQKLLLDNDLASLYPLRRADQTSE